MAQAWVLSHKFWKGICKMGTLYFPSAHLFQPPGPVSLDGLTT